MAISKITLNGVTQMDVTGKTVTSGSMLNGITSLKNDGTDITGSILSQAGSIIISDECDDLVDGRLRYVNTNYNNAYYSWSNGVCTVTTPNGAVSSAGSVYQLLSTSPDTLPSTVIPGETYLVTCESTSSYVRLRIVFRDSSNNNISPEINLTESSAVAVPSNAVSWVLQIHVAPNTVLSPSATIGNIHTYTMEMAVQSGEYTTGDIIVAVASSEFVGSGISRRSSSDLTASGATVTAPAGYYESAATTSVASGTAGTPTATKGTVSNHSISVSPSVTNTTGYITGGTKTGTAVSVSASELVSGTKSISTSGTTDVTNYASASVAAGSLTVGASKGTVSSHSISVSPYVDSTSGFVGTGRTSGTAVTVSASELVSGTLSITSSGTKDVTNYESASVAAGTEGTPTATKGTVSGNQVTVTPSVTNSAGYISGGTHTGTGVTVTWPLVTGTFTGTTSGAAMDVTIPYTGSGYPIAVIIYPSEGCYNSNGTFYSTINPYACVYFSALKTVPDTAPTYTTGTNNNSQTHNRYKSSSSDATALVSTPGHVNDFRDIAATAGAGSIMQIRSATKISVFIKASSYGFAPNVEYTYQIIYSA